MYSDAFLNDSYLKYVGWTMHDKVSHAICQITFVGVVKHVAGSHLLCVSTVVILSELKSYSIEV